MPGMIGMASGDQLRYSQFVTSIIGLSKPDGTVFMQAYGFSVAINWNAIAKQFLDHPVHLDWLLLVEDDHLLPQNALKQLISHDKDIVSALYVQRQIPFAPVMYDKIDEKGQVYYRALKNNDRGLIKVEACGGGCLLIKRRVFEKIESPYWFFGDSSTLDATNHDINFCRKVKKAGLEIWVDLELPILHVMTIPVIPYRDPEGNWHTRLTQGEDKTIEVGCAQ